MAVLKGCIAKLLYCFTIYNSLLMSILHIQNNTAIQQFNLLKQPFLFYNLILETVSQTKLCLPAR